MIDALSLALTISCLLAALTLAGSTVARTFRRSVYTPTLVIVELGLLVQAMLDLAAWLRGHRPGEPAIHAAYLVASLIVAPLAAFETRRDDSGWSAGILIIAFVVLAVLVVRMQTTWRTT